MVTPCAAGVWSPPALVYSAHQCWCTMPTSISVWSPPEEELLDLRSVLLFVIATSAPGITHVNRSAHAARCFQ